MLRAAGRYADAWYPEAALRPQDYARGLETVRNSHIAKAFALNIPGEMWMAHAAEHPLGRKFAGAQDLLPQTIDERTALSYAAQVPVSLIKEFFLTGTPRDIIDQAAGWRDHGLRYLVVMNLSILQPSLRKGLAANAPFFKTLRGLKKL
jgi:phthiodiolone/phenolphthiodiolone dimycocerosates ketoreductase